MKALSLLLVFLLWGCQATNAPEVESPTLTPPVAPIPQVVEVVEVRPEPIVIAPSKPRFVIETIMNLAPATLLNILGNPSLKRKEKDVRVWLYKNKECVLHLYFYPNENGDFRLDYVETTGVDLSADNPTVSPNACLTSHVIPEMNGPDIIEGPESSSSDTDTDPQPDKSGN